MKTKKAAVLPAAGKSTLQIKPYQKSEPLSNLKSEIGILLLCLQFPLGQKVSRIGWTLFERLLRRYVCHRISQNIFNGRPGCAERTNGR